MSALDRVHLNKAVTRLLYRLEKIEQKYPELTDTQVRERLHKMIFGAFNGHAPEYRDDFGMSSVTANVRLRDAVEEFLGSTWYCRNVLKLEQRLAALEPLAEYIGRPEAVHTTRDKLTRSFIHYRRAWYAQPGGPHPDVADEVKVYLSEDDHTVCSMRLEWVPGGDGLTARLVVFNDEWQALTLMPEVLKVLAEREGVLTEPSRFCKLLANLGYEDATPLRQAA